jgi:hypothetical protein
MFQECRTLLRKQDAVNTTLTNKRMVSFNEAPRLRGPTLIKNPTGRLDSDCIDSFPTHSAQGNRYSHAAPM